MKTVARALIYLAGMVGGCIVMIYPLFGFVQTGQIEPKEFVAHVVLGGLLVFCGCEASERLKERWK